MGDKQKIAEALGNACGKIFYNEPMSHHTSLRVGGNADALVVIENEDQLAQIVRKLKQGKINYLPVGNLTNIIVRDGGYRGVILLMSGLKEINYQQMPDGGHYLCVQAGATLASVVGLSVNYELTGLEFCAGIPGSVGGAVWMNAGAFGAEMKDVVTEISVLDVSGQKRTMLREEIVFDYRRTVLPEKAIILNSRLKLAKGKRGQIQARIKEIMRLRREKHPLEYPSAGSIFKNLPAIPAGRIIEEIGLKGEFRGDAEVSQKHANFIVNKDKATAADVLALIGLIQDKAKKEKDINLETEVIVIGEN
ncbi:MAG: UDP-N-acetylmuramate dehydrogenase [Smithellaceae bacterium]